MNDRESFHRYSLIQSFKGTDLLTDFKYLEKYLDNGILDVLMIRKLSKYIKVHQNKSDYALFASNLKSIIKKKFSKTKSPENLIIIETYISFLLILILNQKDNLSFLLSVFGQSSVVETLVELGENMSNKSEGAKRIKGMVNSLFMKEFKLIFFRKDRVPQLEDIYIKMQKSIVTLQEGIEAFDCVSYNLIFELLLNLGIDYSNIEENIRQDITPSSLENIKSNIINCIIRIIFSKEKYQFLKPELQEGKFIEFNFIYSVVYKYLSEIKIKYGDDYEKVFKKESIYGDIIKAMFFSYGGDIFVGSVVEPFIALTNSYRKLKKKSKSDTVIDTDNYEIFINDLILKINDLPYILKVILKIIYSVTSELFTFKIEENKLLPLYTFIFFEFFFSEKVIKIFDFEDSQEGSQTVKTLGLFIRNIIYGVPFKEDSGGLEVFNHIVLKYNKQLQKIIKENVLKIDEKAEASKALFKQIALSLDLEIPSFLFNLDCLSIIPIAPGGFDDIVLYNELNK